MSDREGQPCRPNLSALERRVIDADAVRTLGSAWQRLAERAARSPFVSPAWLLSRVDHNGSLWQPRMVSWWRGDDLVGVASIAWRRRVRRGLPVRELTFWGRTETPLRGWVDIVADEDVAQEVASDFAAWLARPGQDWDLFHYLHLRARLAHSRGADCPAPAVADGESDQGVALAGVLVDASR